jgi:putative copper resistance protein D
MIWAAPVLWLHLLAAIFWVGGQLFLVLVVMPVLKQELGEADRVRIAARTGRRFARISAAALGVLLVTGPLNAIDHGVSWSILANTEWGHILVVKVLLVLIMLVLTAVHGAYFGRKLEQLAAAAVADPSAAARRAALQRQSVRVSATNLLLNIAIVGLAAWLATLP